MRQHTEDALTAALEQGRSARRGPKPGAPAGASSPDSRAPPPDSRADPAPHRRRSSVPRAGCWLLLALSWPLPGCSRPLLGRTWAGLVVLLAASCLAQAAPDATKRPPGSILGGIFLPQTMIIGLLLVASRASVSMRFLLFSARRYSKFLTFCNVGQKCTDTLRPTESNAFA